MSRASLAVLGLLACGGPDTGDEPAVLTVLAASSLTEAFTELEAGFEAEHAGVDVVLSFAGSQALATQIRHGIQADVFASANEAHIHALVEEGLVDAPRPFADNALVILVPEGEGDRMSLLALPEVDRLVVGGAEVPVGAYTLALFEAAEARYGEAWRASVEARIVSREPNVRLVAGKVAMGEADAAVVYATDARAVPGVRAIGVPDGLGPVARYHHARLGAAPSPELAQAWLEWVESAPGQEVLARSGFRPGAAAP